MALPWTSARGPLRSWLAQGGLGLGLGLSVLGAGAGRLWASSALSAPGAAGRAVPFPHGLSLVPDPCPHVLPLQDGNQVGLTPATAFNSPRSRSCL